MNQLLPIDRLANRYFAMRHGHSLANAQAIIVSHPQNGCSGYGLSDQGRAQVKQSLRRAPLLDAETVIFCSDFKRAHESAEIVHSLLGCAAPLAVELRLRERDFGEFELRADSNYENVWRRDMSNLDDPWCGVEHVDQVMHRVTSLIIEIENRYSGACILLVSHGDALQILQTAFARRAAAAHRQLQHLQTAEIRRLHLSPPHRP